MQAIYFKASWCGPCKVWHPKFIEACEALGDKITYRTVDAVEQEEECDKYGIRNVPAVVILDDEGNFIMSGRAEDIIPKLPEICRS